MQTFIADVSSGRLAIDIENRHRAQIHAAQGRIAIAYGRIDEQAVLRLEFPDGQEINVDGLLPGENLTFQKVRGVVIPLPPQGQGPQEDAEDVAN